MSKVTRILGRIGLDKAMAAGTAALAAVAVLLIPVDILSNAVARAGLDTMFAPLQPPIGAKARIGLALLVAGMVFGVVLTAMGLLDKFAAKRPARARPMEAEEAEAAPPAPRLRRRDSHPDAPARAPFSPVSELGSPDTAIEQAETRSGRLRRFRADPVAADMAPQVAAPWPESDPVETTAEPAAEPVASDPFLERPPAAPAPLFVPEPEPEPEIAAAPAPVIVQPDPVAEEAQPDVPERRIGERRRPQPEERTGRESIAELMTRLERALGAEPPIVEAPAPVQQDLGAPPLAASALEPEPEPVGDDRLRSAIEHLKKVASRA